MTPNVGDTIILVTNKGNEYKTIATKYMQKPAKFRLNISDIEAIEFAKKYNIEINKK